ncbi:hypothetical protein ABEB36_004390 [Hypothenemus hampei]|uniref:Uncharacterized protein n=1 Tax=Hypothenemus hampei TaxID=57062 RepID=A0ABD1F361_HYPHA
MRFPLNDLIEGEHNGEPIKGLLMPYPQLFNVGDFTNLQTLPFTWGLACDNPDDVTDDMTIRLLPPILSLGKMEISGRDAFASCRHLVPLTLDGMTPRLFIPQDSKESTERAMFSTPNIAGHGCFSHAEFGAN